MVKLEKALAQFKDELLKAGVVPSVRFTHPDDFKASGLSKEQHSDEATLHNNAANLIKKHVINMRHAPYVEGFPHINKHIAEFNDNIKDHYNNSMTLKNLHEKAANELDKQ